MTPMTFWQRLQNIVVVTLITALLWLYAEGESLREMEVPMNLQIVPPTDELLVEGRQPHTVTVRLRYPTDRQAFVHATTAAPVDLRMSDLPTELEIQRPAVVRDWLRHYFENKGVSIISTDPKTIDLRTESLTTRTLDVEFALPEGWQVTDTAVMDIRQASVQAPTSMLAGVEGLKLQAQLSPNDLRQMQEGVPRTYVASLVLPQSFWDRLPASLKGKVELSDIARIVPASAKVTVTIRRQMESLTLPNVPVMVAAAPSELERFSVRLADKFLRDVKITGPRDSIEAIRAGTIPVWAQFRLGGDDLERRITSAAITFPTLPDQVRVISPVAPMVNFTIVPKEGAAVTPAPVPTTAP